ncbi:hypothetical protein PR202_ga14337 [Eleusine coracana subsp. coracana]|uniref:Uncharacterized protein n=1 Tax=Eleusine coracana subsp. coracana TaxID=191504 RepID=A0AAV5CGJ7_ELECO|nr:hypothetical protein PR202_ga14337 [Eleusine coracana subsp. coracana]
MHARKSFFAVQATHELLRLSSSSKHIEWSIASQPSLRKIQRERERLDEWSQTVTSRDKVHFLRRLRPQINNGGEILLARTR